LGTALGTTQTLANKTALTPYPEDIYKIIEHLAALIERYGAVANAVRAGIDTTDDAGDADTADILTGFSRALDKSHVVSRSPPSGNSLKSALANLRLFSKG
jgi:starvation-inducible DNA-binding protein